MKYCNFERRIYRYLYITTTSFLCLIICHCYQQCVSVHHVSKLPYNMPLLLAMCNRTSCPQVHELPQSHCGDNREGTLFLWLYIYYARLASVRFEHSLCHGKLMTTYITTYSFWHNNESALSVLFMIFMISMGYSRKKFHQGWGYMYLSGKAKFFRFANLTLQIPEKKGFHPYKFSKIVWHLLEILRSKTITHGNSTWLFQEHPWKFHFFFN